MYFSLSSEAVAKYWFSKGFFDSEKDALRVSQSVFTERDTDPRGSLIEFIEKSIGNGRADEADIDRVKSAINSRDWETVMAILGRINFIDGLSKSAIPGYGQAMLLADEAKYRQGITSNELLKLDYLLKERGKISVLAKSHSDEQNDFTVSRLGSVEIEAQEIWAKVVTTIKG